jgi:O-antigen/teichoic acid export membrane protein
VARQDVVASTFFIIASQASKTVIFIIAAISAGSVRALIDAAIVQGVIQICVLLVYLRAKFPGFWSGFDWQTLQTQASYALPLGLSGLVLKFQSDLPHYFVAHAFGASEYAIFTVGVFNLPLVGLLRESVGSVMLPRVSRLEQEQDRFQILELVSRVARKLALFYFPMYVFLMVVGHEFITVLFTRQYLASWPIFAVYLLVIPFGVIVLDPITRAYADQRFFLLKLRVALFAITIAVFAVGVRRLGLVGTVAFMVAVQVAGTFGAGIRLSHVMGLRARDFARFAVLGRIGGAALAAGIVSAATRLALVQAGPYYILVACAMTYTATYAAAILAGGILESSEWALLRGLMRRESIPAARTLPAE